MNISIWPGSSSFEPNVGDTPFGFYDDDPDFQTDSDKFATFSSRRLGYPIMDVELQDIHFYTAFEEAVTTYGNEVFAFKIRENQLSLEGADASVDVTNSTITPGMGNIIRLSKQYGAEAGSGGNITWYDGSVDLISNKQVYDLNAWAKERGLDCKGGIEIKKVFFETPPAITQYYDPYSGTGFGFQGLFNSFGFAAMSPATNYLMMPLSFDLQTIQAIEMNQQVRKSNYSFELINNQLRVFPIPNATGGRMKFQYIINGERLAASVPEGDGAIANRVTSVLDAPYSNPTYSRINAPGRQWIFEYALAFVRETLGDVRNKYSQIPIPNSEVQLNGDALISQGREDRFKLIDRLREYLEQTSRRQLLERRADESEFRSKELNQVPMVIYVGILAALIGLSNMSIFL
tara:strand:+ start:208 stop:1419 length:1212 start_codon:yes stop_codon:yes gene_type:complete